LDGSAAVIDVQLDLPWRAFARQVDGRIGQQMNAIDLGRTAGLPIRVMRSSGM
jgi:hypothetical protein